MSTKRTIRSTSRARRTTWLGTAVAILFGVAAVLPSSATAATASVDLATADQFAVLAGSGITNTGPTTITGDIGTFPTPSQDGFGSVTLTGTNQASNAVTQLAKDHLVTAYGTAAGRGPATEIVTNLGGATLAPGVYDSASGTFGNDGILTLDGQGQTNPVFVFQMASTLITASASRVELINGANACNVYWQVGSSATLGTGSNLKGTILALTSITMTTGATLQGRALARNGAVTMDTNTITRASCASTTNTTTSVTATPSNPATSDDVTLTATVTADDSSSPTGTVEFFDGDTSLGTATLDGGTATLTGPFGSPGTHTITVVYPGAPGYGASSSPDLDLAVSGPAGPTGPFVPGTPTGPGAPGTPAAPPAPVTPGTPRFTG